MGCEVQKDVKFAEIEVGDLIVMQVFNADNTALIEERRGVATHKMHLDPAWHFDGMGSLYADTSVNYRLFRVEPPSQAEVELERLRKIEAGLRGYVERHTELAGKLGAQAVMLRSSKNYVGAQNLSKDADDIMFRVRRLEAILNG